MPRRNSYPGGKWSARPNSAYARSTGWPTRYYQRKVGGSIVTSMVGINTTSDDFAKREGESPYLWNVRLNGSKERRKRAQSMSRLGQKFFVTPEGCINTTEAKKGDIKIAISENKSIRWRLGVTGKLTDIGLRFAFDNKPVSNNAQFVIIIRDENMHELCRAYRQVAKLKANAGNEEWFKLIRTIDSSNITLEATLVDDFNDSGTPSGMTMYILGNGSANHTYSFHDLPNLDKSLREMDYVWEKGVSIPSTSTKTTTWESFPVWLQNGYFNSGGTRYVPLGVKHDGVVEIYAVPYATIDLKTGGYSKIDNPEPRLMVSRQSVDQNASQVRMTQAGNCLYYVDGTSPLRKVNLDDWTVSDAKPDMSEVDTFGFVPNNYYYKYSIIIAAEEGQPLKFQRCKEDFQAGDTFSQENWEELDDGSSLTAWPGASLIYFLNNRLILSGFMNATVGEDTPKAEPNLVIMSSIDSVKPQYDMFNRSLEFFYVPDNSPSQSASNPVTAFAHLGDNLLVFTSSGLRIETIQSSVEFGGIAQSVPEGSQYGVMKQEHVCEGRNNVYFYNPTMGVMRTAGSTAVKISSPIDSEIQKLDDAAQDKIVLSITESILRVYYSPDGGDNTQAFIDYTDYAQHRSYWFRDQNVPTKSMYVDNGTDSIISQHSEYPCLMLVEDSDNYKDFDCAVLYEYYTKYIGTPDKLDHVIVRRVHVSTLQTYSSSMYIGLDYDHNNKPIVWRKFVKPVSQGEYYPTDIFGDDEEAGATNLDIRILTNDTRFVQIRIKQYCYDFQAEILQVGFEYANRTVL